MGASDNRRYPRILPVTKPAISSPLRDPLELLFPPFVAH